MLGAEPSEGLFALFRAEKGARLGGRKSCLNCFASTNDAIKINKKIASVCPDELTVNVGKLVSFPNRHPRLVARPPNIVAENP